MRHAIAIYARLVGASLRAQLSYRASTVMFALGHLITTGIEFAAIWALFERFGEIRGWTLPEVAILYGMINIAFAIAEGVGRGFDVFDQMVRTGDFDRVLLRPIDPALQIVSSDLQLLRLGRLTQGAIILAWGAGTLGVDWGAPELALLLLAIAAATCVFLGTFVLQATMCFWSIEGLEIVNTLTYGGVQTMEYPLPIYQRWMQRLFMVVVPLGSCSYLPALALLHRSDPLGSPAWLCWISPAIGPLFLWVSLAIFQLGVRRYRSTGS